MIYFYMMFLVQIAYVVYFWYKLRVTKLHHFAALTMGAFILGLIWPISLPMLLFSMYNTFMMKVDMIGKP